MAKNALYEVSTLLHQNPRKESIPLNPLSGDAHGFYPSGAPLPPGNQRWSHRNSGPRGPPPMPWFGGYGNERPGFAAAGFNADPARTTGEAAEFSMKILCSAEKAGGVIGKGGANVKMLQQETGTNIVVDGAVPDLDERVITVSAMEVSYNLQKCMPYVLLEFNPEDFVYPLNFLKFYFCKLWPSVLVFFVDLTAWGEGPRLQVVVVQSFKFFCFKRRNLQNDKVHSILLALGPRKSLFLSRLHFQ